MTDLLLEDRRGRRALLLGNEAIVRGAIEAGVAFASGYPGTPASEVGDTLARLAPRLGIHFEYSVNEKVALETAFGASLTGVRAICSMKHLGLNYAGDPLSTMPYVGTVGGMVIVSASDPSMHTSPNEQDQRNLAETFNVPMLEPSTPEEARAMTRAAFDLSEELELPVILRPTTRVSHTRAVVTFGPVRPVERKGLFRPDPQRFVPIPANARRLRPVLLERIRRAEAEAVRSPFNTLAKGGPIGIVTAGVPATYVLDFVRENDLAGEVSVLKIGTLFPLPRDLMRSFLESVRQVLVVEELNPYMERALKVIAQEAGIEVPVLGKGSGLLPPIYEYTPEMVGRAVRTVLGLPEAEAREIPRPELPGRPPVLCPACAHRATYYGVKTAYGDEAVYLNDIGCYTLGYGPPLNTADALLCMGSGITQAAGIARTTDKPVVAFIGDSTFFHSGMPALLNAVQTGADLLVVILNNATTGMTGFQPNPASEVSWTGESTRAVPIEPVVRSLGVTDVETIDPFDLRQAVSAFGRMREGSGVRVLISDRPCWLHDARLHDRPLKAASFDVDPDRCKSCGDGHDPRFCPGAIHPDEELGRSARRILAGPESWPSEGPAPAPATTAPCTAACPVNVCVQGFVGLIAAGRPREALETVRERLPLPSICARVCHRPCEAACVRDELDEAVAVNDLKRFATDLALSAGGDDPDAHPEGPKVAVIGSGPAGLACAADLARRGYRATIFEAHGVPGGMLTLGIPEFRLPRDVLRADIAWIESLGVEIRCNVTVGKDPSLEELFDQGYGAAFLGVGAQKGTSLKIPGRDASGVEDALAFLARVNLDADRSVGRRVAVVGGGDAALDAARTAMRLGAEEVRILYRRSRAEMPASAREVDEAEREGVAFQFLSTPIRAFTEEGRVVALECLRTELGEPDEGGRRRPVPVPGSEFTAQADHVIEAIGQSPVLDGLAEELGLDLTPAGAIRVDTRTGQSSHPKIFAGGDVVTGPATVIDAIAAGKRAAHGIDLLLAEDDSSVEPLITVTTADLPEDNRYRPAAVEVRPRLHPPSLTPEERRGSFAEVEGGYDARTAVQEADRCLACGRCACCNNCIDNFGCPAIFMEEGRIKINDTLCRGCGVCVQICPNGAIYEVKAEGE